MELTDGVVTPRPAGIVREGVLRAHIRFREGRRDSVLFSLIPPDLIRPEVGLDGMV